MDIDEVIKQLKSADSKEKCLDQVYDLLSKRFHGERIKTLSRIWELFPRDINKLWNRKQGFMHCTNINRLARYLLAASGHFFPEDIRTKWTTIWFVSPHQYLKIKVTPGRTIDMDIWAKQFGIRLGDHAHGFH